MTFYKFHEDDLFVNTIEAYPEYKFYIQGGIVYLDDELDLSGSEVAVLGHIPKGHVSLYEYNVDRKSGNDIYPFLLKNSSKDTFRSLSRKLFNTQYDYGNSNLITSSYMMSASISRDFYSTDYDYGRSRLNSLKTVLNHYNYLSPHYRYTSSIGGDKAEHDVNLISIPSIMYGSSIKKGSVSLKYYVTGSLIGELTDFRRNGELVQIGPEGSTGSGSVGGVVLYNEGFVVITGSWDLSDKSYLYENYDKPKWKYFAHGIKNSTGSAGQTVSSTGNNAAISSSYVLEYSGTTSIQTVTMFAQARRGDLNYSNNPTFLTSSALRYAATSSSDVYLAHGGNRRYEESPRTLRNVAYSQFIDEVPELEKTVYISKIGLYDENKNLIGVAKMATPVRKVENQAYTFKLKLDI